MGYRLRLTSQQLELLRGHLFQNELEQGAFLFARAANGAGSAVFAADRVHLIPKEGWNLQQRFHLEMNDDERARIMRTARELGLLVVDCHSHPMARRADFSWSDVAGIREFAPYVHWKLGAHPYVAMVWAPSSVDGVVWLPGATQPVPLTGIEVVGGRPAWLACVGSWPSTVEDAW